MRRAVIISLVTLALVSQAAAQQQYAGKEQDAVRRCFDDSIRKLGDQNVQLGDFAVIAVGLCDASITAYRNFVLALEGKGGASGAGLQSRAEAAMAAEFRRAKDAYTAYLKKGSEKRTLGPVGEADA